MLYFVHFVIIFSLFQGIWGEFANNTEQEEIASRPQLENNFGETPERQRNRNGSTEMILQRKTRVSENKGFYEGMKCLSCYAQNGTSMRYSKCLDAFRVPFENCTLAQQCYTEINPLYIKRGCIYPDRINKTFYCKCPLCNDRPSDEPEFYNYLSLRDWEYDNARLQKRNPNDKTMCKLCQSYGAKNNICGLGKSTGNLFCSDDHLCFTHIDSERGFVSRGCVSRPVYNSIYFFCNNSACNNASFAEINHKPRTIDMRELQYKAETDTSQVDEDSVIVLSANGILLFMGVFILSFSGY